MSERRTSTRRRSDRLQTEIFSALAAIAAIFAPAEPGGTPIPMLEKISYIGTVWILSIMLSAMVLTPVLLSWCGVKKRYAHPINVYPLLQKILGLCAAIVTSKLRFAVVAGAAGAGLSCAPTVRRVAPKRPRTTAAAAGTARPSART